MTGNHEWSKTPAASVWAPCDCYLDWDLPPPERMLDHCMMCVWHAASAGQGGGFAGGADPRRLWASSIPCPEHRVQVTNLCVGAFSRSFALKDTT